MTNDDDDDDDKDDNDDDEKMIANDKIWQMTMMMTMMIMSKWQ